MFNNDFKSGDYILMNYSSFKSIFLIVDSLQNAICVGGPHEKIPSMGGYWNLSTSWSRSTYVPLGSRLSDLHKIIFSIDFPILEE